MDGFLASLVGAWRRVWFIRDEDGQGLVEYALVLALIAVVCFAALALFGTKVDNLYNYIQNAWPV